MKKRWLIGLSIAAAWFFLLRLLILVESADPDALIRTMADALWFALVTVTTAGYGDLYPVTSGGRLIGIVFLLLSTGFLAAMMAAAFSLVTGRLMPWFKLRLAARRPWYIFPALNPESAALASALSKEQPNAVLVLCEEISREKEWLLAGIPWYRADRPLSQILRRRSGNTTFIALGPDERKNYTLAREAEKLGIRACCQAGFCPDTFPTRLILFDYCESCARLYWQQHPLRRDERKILLLGSGQYATTLLIQSLLVNLSHPDQQISYYLVGDWTDFCRSHPYLDEILAMRGTNIRSGSPHPGDIPPRDSLIFLSGPWNADPVLLASADRILLCGDEDDENLSLLRELTRWFPVQGQIFIRLNTPLEGLGAVIFGSDAELFTPDIVLRTRLDALAVSMHEIYRRSVGSQVPAWEALNGFLRRSNLAAADHLSTKVRILLEDDEAAPLTPDRCKAAYARWQTTHEEKVDFYRELEHLRWMRYHCLHNWHFAPKKDNLRRFHPDLRPYEELTPAERAKDDYAWELLGTLAETIDITADKGV